MLFKRKIEKRTEYDVVKNNKKNGFTFLNQNYCKKGQVVLFGDSITEIFNTTELFEAYSKKPGLTVYNRGISGDTSDRLFERLEENVINIEPKTVVILIGTNDLGVGADENFTAANVKKIIDKLKKSLPQTKIILQAVYPVNPFVSLQGVGRRKNSDILSLNRKLKALAEKEKIIYIDLTEALSDKSGNFSKEYTYDGLHPNAKGFAVAAKKLIEVI